MRILHFGTFDRDVGRNAIVAEALRAAGVDVVECHAPLWRDTDDKLRAVRRAGGASHAGHAGHARGHMLIFSAISGLAITAARVVRAHGSLLRQVRALRRDGRAFDVVLVGSTGHLDMPLARMVADELGAALVFDPLVSIGETVRDRGLLPPDGRRMKVLNRVERRLFALADHVLIDTAAHAEALEREVGLDRRRVSIIPAGAPAAVSDVVGIYRGRTAPADPIRVVYAGQYIPLHGIEVVLRSADRLRDRDDIRFELVGIGQTLGAAKALAAELALPNVRFIETWMPLERLAREHLAAADICLGIFGDQPKAGRVVPFKVYAALAAGRPVITADTPAVRELLAVGPRTDVGDRTDIGDRVPVGDRTDVEYRFAVDERTDVGHRIDVGDRMDVGYRWDADNRIDVAHRPSGPPEVATVPPGDPEALASAILALAGDPVRRRALAYSGRAAWTARFAPAVLGASIVQALELAMRHVEPPRLEGPRHRWRTERLARELLDAAPPGPLLDAGCGHGTMLVRLASGTASQVVLGFDRDRDRLRAARRRARAAGRADTVHVFVADMTALPLRSREMAGAAAGEVLEHVADDRAAAAEIARVLRPGGAFTATVPAGPERYGALDRAVGHVRRYDRSGIERVLRDAGFSVDRSIGLGVPFGRLYDRIAQRPALTTALRVPRTVSLLSRLARSEVLSAIPRALFALDSRFEGSIASLGRMDWMASGWMIRATRTPSQEVAGWRSRTDTPERPGPP